MIADIQTQATVIVAPEKTVEYKIVQDTELAYVGGGNSASHF